MSLNKVLLKGNVGKDPEVRETNGAKVVSFPLATTEVYVDRAGDRHENTDWHNIVAWRKTAEFIEKYVKKGSSLYVEGKLRSRSYESNGVKKYITEVVADKVEPFGRFEKPQTDAAEDFPEAF